MNKNGSVYWNNKIKLWILCYIAIAAVVFAGCAHVKFPVIHPVKEEQSSEIATIKAQEYFVRARDYERRGLQQSAERYYEMAYELEPSSVILQEQLTKKYLENGKYAQALILVKKNRSNNELSRDEKRTVATIYLKMGEFDKAVELLEGIDQKTEEDVYSLGLIYESMGNNAKALENYLKYYQNNPDALQIGFKIGKLLLAEKKYSQAESLFLQMKSVDNVTPDIYTQLGNVMVVKGDTVSAIVYFDSALALDTINEEALRNKAQIYIGRNDYPVAIICYEKLFNSSSFGEVYGRTLALLYYYNKQYTKAEELLDNLLQQSIDDYELHYYLGLVFSASENYDNAKIELEKALLIRNEFDDAWRELCFVSIREKQFQDAFDVAKRYTTAFPESDDAWRLQGYVALLCKSFPLAIESLTHAIKLDTTDTQSWFDLGSAYERNGQIDKAADAFSVVLKRKPNDAATLNYLGYMWAEKGKNLDSAKVLLQAALAQDSANGAFLDSYAWVLYQSGNIDSAAIYIKKAMIKITDDPVVFSHLGDILVKQNQYIGAIAAFRKALEFHPDNEDEIRSKVTNIELLIRRDRK